MKRLILLLTLLFTPSCGLELQDPSKFGLSHPPLKNDFEMAFTTSHLKQLQVHQIRYDENWELREPKNGSYNWLPLDKRINYVSNNNLSLLLTINSSGADWACGEKITKKSCVYRNEYEFKEYITALTKRYANKIDRIQFGNEWEDPAIYPGSAEDYVRFFNIFHDAVKTHSPNTEVVLGGITKLYFIGALFDAGINITLDKLMLKNRPGAEISKYKLLEKRPEVISRVEYVIINAKYDIVDVHLYDDYENWEKYIDVVQKLTDKPIIASEFGGPNPDFEIYNPIYQAKQLSHYLETMSQLPIISAYYFNLLEGDNSYHKKSGLIGFALLKKPAYWVFKHR